MHTSLLKTSQTRLVTDCYVLSLDFSRPLGDSFCLQRGIPGNGYWWMWTGWRGDDRKWHDHV